MKLKDKSTIKNLVITILVVVFFTGNIFANSLADNIRACKGDDARIRKVLASANNLGEVDEERGATALQDAVQRGDIRLIELLIEAAELRLAKNESETAKTVGEILGLESRDLEGKTAFDWILSSKHLPFIQLFIRIGANIDQKLGENSLQHQMWVKNPEISKGDMVTAADFNPFEEWGYEISYFEWAIICGNMDFLEAFLPKLQRMDIKQRIEALGKFLYLAARTGHVGIMSQLLDEGAKLTEADRHSDSVPEDFSGLSSEAITQSLTLPFGIGQLGRMGNTLLHHAALYGHCGIVRLLLERGADVNALRFRNTSSLQLAARNGHIDVVRLLLEKGADVNILGLDARTALHDALEHGHVKVADLLLDATVSANVGQVDDLGKTALHSAVLKGYVDIVSRLLVAGSDVNILDKKQRAALHYATKKGHTEIVDMLLKAGANIHAIDVNGQTALHHAAINGHEAVVGVLLGAGANIHAIDVNGQTALHHAAINGHVEIMRRLLEAKGDINAVDENGQTAFHLAVMNGRVNVLKELTEANADTQVLDKFRKCAHDYMREYTSVSGNVKFEMSQMVPPLQLPDVILDDAQELADAAKKGDEESILELLRYIKFEDNEILLARNNAAINHRNDILRLLLNEEVSVGLVDGTGMTTLHYAAIHGNLDAVVLLIQGGADVTVKDGNGRTALDCAKLCACPQVINVLWAAQNGFGAKRDLVVPPDEFGIYLPDSNVDRDYLKMYWQNNNLTTSQQLTLRNIMIRFNSYVFPNLSINMADALGRTTLHYAAVSASESSINALLRDGACRCARDNYGMIPLHFAAINGRLDAVTALLSEDTINIADYRGMTALHLAARSGYPIVVSKLLMSGANAEAVDGYGKKAFDYAVEEKNNRTIRVFLGYTKDAYTGCNAIMNDLILCTSVDRGVYTPTRDCHGRTFLHYVANWGRHDMIEKMAATGGDFGQNNKDEDGRTALHFAARVGYIEIVKTLLLNKADPNITDNNGWRAFDLAVINNQVDIVNALIAAGVSKYNVDVNGRTVLHHAAKSHDATMTQTLLNAGFNPNILDRDGRTALHIAVIEGHDAVVGALLKGGADQEIRDTKGYTALQCAELCGWPQIINTLQTVENGGNGAASAASAIDETDGNAHDDKLVAFPTDERKNFLIKAAQDGQLDELLVDGWTTIHEILAVRNAAAATGDYASLPGLLKDNVYMYALDDKGMAIVHYAAGRRDDNINNILVLLRYLRNQTLADKNGRTPLHIAAMNGCDNIVQELLSVIPQYECNLKDDKGMTALHYAVVNNHANIVRLLLVEVADATIKDKNGRTPLDYAALYEYEEIIRILKNPVDRGNEGGSAMLIEEDDDAADPEGMTQPKVVTDAMGRGAPGVAGGVWPSAFAHSRPPEGNGGGN
jgi:ankyrin repeat protein